MGLPPFKLGDIVTYRVKLNTAPQATSEYADYPAIVWRLYLKEWSSEMKYPLGLTVFEEGIPRRLGKVLYSTEPAEGCWTDREHALTTW